MPRPQHLPLRLGTEHHDQRLVHRVPEIDSSARLGQPHLDADPLEQRRHLCELVARERPLVLADHHRVEPSGGRGQLCQQCSGLGAGGPRQPPRTALVEKLDHDRSMAGDQVIGNLALPRT
jgi:hypothetical protein